ncbi:MAG TPA: helix-turn-helix domain-containing protein [Pseudoxanthomonas sp.]|nr:helix-turn-helix domain-containing protein [Pseudoxanthomonas sp.]
MPARPAMRTCCWSSSMSAAERFDEAEAARRLGISKATLARVRLAGGIHPIRIGPRVIRYTQAILDEYEQKCRNVSAKLETSGSASVPARSSGAARGTTSALDRQSAHLLAQRTFKKAS